MRGAKPERTAKARSFRREPSGAEARFWAAVQNRQIEGFKFARQVPIGPYFADFVCRSRKLVIELDGPSHEEVDAIEHDARRTAYLLEQGYSVMRFKNEDVLESLEHVLGQIAAALNV